MQAEDARKGAAESDAKVPLVHLFRLTQYRHAAQAPLTLHNIKSSVSETVTDKQAPASSHRTSKIELYSHYYVHKRQCLSSKDTATADVEEAVEVAEATLSTEVVAAEVEAEVVVGTTLSSRKDQRRRTSWTWESIWTRESLLSSMAVAKVSVSFLDVRGRARGHVDPPLIPPRAEASGVLLERLY